MVAILGYDSLPLTLRGFLAHVTTKFRAYK